MLLLLDVVILMVNDLGLVLLLALRTAFSFQEILLLYQGIVELIVEL